MMNDLLSNLKAIKTELVKQEEENKKIEQKEQKEARLKKEFEAYVQNNGVKKLKK